MMGKGFINLTPFIPLSFEGEEDKQFKAERATPFKREFGSQISTVVPQAGNLVSFLEPLRPLPHRQSVALLHHYALLFFQPCLYQGHYYPEVNIEGVKLYL